MFRYKYHSRRELDKKSQRMDATGPDHVRTLRLLGEKLVRDNAVSLEALAASLTKEKKS